MRPVAVAGEVSPRLDQVSAASECFPLFFRGEITPNPFTVCTCLTPCQAVDRVVKPIGELPITLDSLRGWIRGNAGPSRDAGTVLGLGDFRHCAYELFAFWSDGGGPGRAVEAVVNDAIAIVVDGIAAFHDGRAGYGIADRIPVLADRVACNCALAPTAAAVHATFSRVVVNDAIAVIVQPVADFWGGENLGGTDTPAVLAEAYAHPVAAGADAASGWGASVAGLVEEFIIVETIAVVVETIALFGDGENLLCAGLVSRAALVAAARTGAAGADSFCEGGAVVAGSDGDRGAQAPQAVVDRAVAVVVGSVDAVFVAWVDFSHALGQQPFDALLGAAAAGANALGGGRAAVAADPHAGAAVVVFVGLAVAVVVEVVTEFWGRLERRSRAAELPVHPTALHDSLGSAFAESDRAGLAESDQVVDDAIAVVVKVVTEFGAWR